MGFIDEGSNRDVNVNLDAMERVPQGVQIEKYNWASDISINTATDGTVSDLANIKQSISNILLTVKTERFFNLSFGTNLFVYIFANYTDTSEIKNELMQAIVSKETRITIKSSDITITPSYDNAAIAVDIVFKVKENNFVGRWSETMYV